MREETFYICTFRMAHLLVSISMGGSIVTTLPCSLQRYRHESHAHGPSVLMTRSNFGLCINASSKWSPEAKVRR